MAGHDGGVPDEPRSRVTFALHESDDGTAAERGQDWESLPPPTGPGWTTHLTYLEATVEGDTIPPSQFWKMHATFAALHNGRASTP